MLVRGTVQAALPPLDIAFLRYVTPAVIFLPVLLRTGPLPRGVEPWRMAAMTLGWGFPFALLAAEGLKVAPTALFGALVPGSLPLWVAAIGAAALGARFARRARIGLALVASAAALAVGAYAVDRPEALAGAPWLVAASLAWATYTLAYRGSTLTPVEATAAVAFWSSLVLIPLALVFGLETVRLPLGEAALMIGLHGVLSGAVSVAAFALVIRELGPARAAATTALVPALAAMGGAAFLGETPGAAAIAAVGLTTVGVYLVNTTPRRR